MTRHQRGMTIWGWLYVLGSIGFIAFVTMKLFPVYMEHMSVKKAVGQVASTSGALSYNKEKAWGALVKQFYVDEVKVVTKDDIAVEVNDDGVKELVVAYEVRKPMFYNIDIVVWFEERAPLKE